MAGPRLMGGSILRRHQQTITASRKGIYRSRSLVVTKDAVLIGPFGVAEPLLIVVVHVA